MSTTNLTNLTQLANAFRALADMVNEQEKHPYGKPLSSLPLEKQAKTALVQLCGGDTGAAQTLWVLLVDHFRYMPDGVAWALVRVSQQSNLVPHVEAPEL